MSKSVRQSRRLYLRLAFFSLFVLAPPLNIFRLDLTLGHFVLFGWNWTLGLDAFRAGQVDAATAALHLVVRGFVPVAAILGVFGWVSWYYGRLYCGWLCPHFSVVEAVNALMLRTIGRPTLWERKPLSRRRPDGRTLNVDRRNLYVLVPVILAFSILWAVTLLTYLLPPREIYHNLAYGELTRNQAVFLGVATTLFVLEFTLARHFFCRFGCAVGIFQSLVWMANKKSMVVRFEGARAAACADCNAACDNACPMRLRPRTIKRLKFACTQCAECIDACEQVQAGAPTGSLLNWVRAEEALYMSDRKSGHRYPVVALRCDAGSKA